MLSTMSAFVNNQVKADLRYHYIMNQPHSPTKGLILCQQMLLSTHAFPLTNKEKNPSTAKFANVKPSPKPIS